MEWTVEQWNAYNNNFQLEYLSNNQYTLHVIISFVNFPNMAKCVRQDTMPFEEKRNHFEIISIFYLLNWDV